MGKGQNKCLPKVFLQLSYGIAVGIATKNEEHSNILKASGYWRQGN